MQNQQKYDNISYFSQKKRYDKVRYDKVMQNQQKYNNISYFSNKCGGFKILIERGFIYL